MKKTVKSSINLILVTVGMFVATTLPSQAVGGVGIPQTSQHEQFKPQDVERMAVIVKPVDKQQDSILNRRMNNTIRRDQSQLERMVEQRFMRVLVAKGYTLVSRADLDAAMKEKGLSAANLTDEKLSEVAGKILHVSAIMVVSVDDFKTSSMQRPLVRSGSSGLGQQSAQYFQVLASLGARLIKIESNMVLWTGDLQATQAFASQEQDTTMLGNVAETVALAFPPLKTTVVKK